MTVSVLLTNLPDDERFRAQTVLDLYWRRWAVEVHYREEKTSLDIKTFHSHTENGIRQELFAMLIMTVIARVLMVSGRIPNIRRGGKHAIITLASEAALLAPTCPDVALSIFQELLREIERVRYYPPKMPRPSAPTGNFNTTSRLSGTKHETLRQTNYFIGVRLELYNSSLTPISPNSPDFQRVNSRIFFEG